MLFEQNGTTDYTCEHGVSIHIRIHMDDPSLSGHACELNPKWQTVFPSKRKENTTKSFDGRLETRICVTFCKNF